MSFLKNDKSEFEDMIEKMMKVKEENTRESNVKNPLDASLVYLPLFVLLHFVIPSKAQAQA